MESFQKDGARQVFPLLLKTLSWGILISVSLPIALYMYSGRYVRYFADDFGTANILLDQGFWQAQVFRYLSWTGSYTNSFLIFLVELGGVSIVQWLPALTMGLWVVLLLVEFRLVLRVINISVSKIWIGILSLVIVFCTIKGFKDYTQVIFWQTGIIAYESNIFVLILITTYFLLRFWVWNAPGVAFWEYGIMFLVFFITGGVSETWIIMQIALFALGLFAAFWFGRQRVHDGPFRMLIVGFLASWLALLVTLMSPGNANHAASMGDLSFGRIFNFLLVSLADLPRYLWEWMKDRTVLLVLITLTGFVCGFQNARNSGQRRDGDIHRLRFGVIVFVGGCFMLWMGLFPGYVVFGIRPPDRAVFTSMFVFLWAYALLSLLVGWFVSRSLSPTNRDRIQLPLVLCLAFLVYLSPVRTGFSQVRLFPAFQLYTRLWDARDEFLRGASGQGETDVVVQSIRYNPALRDLRPTIWLLGELEENPNNWKNRFAAQYYGLKSIRGEK